MTVEIPDDLADYRTSAIIGNGIAICGIAPVRRLVTSDAEPCFNCQGRVLRRFSGSGWYEDDFLCMDCGEDVGTRYRPFRRAWRKANVARAMEWLPDFVEPAMFHEHTMRLIREEMDWEDPEPSDLGPEA